MAQEETTAVQLSNVYEGGKTYLFEDLLLSMTIADFKLKVCDRLEENPIPANQRIIHRGKICNDSSTLGSILNSSKNSLSESPHSFHLVLSSRTTSLKRAMSEPVKSNPEKPRSSETNEETSNTTTEQPNLPPLEQPNATPRSTSLPASPPKSRAEIRAAAAAAAEARAAQLSPETNETPSFSLGNDKSSSIHSGTINMNDMPPASSEFRRRVSFSDEVVHSHNSAHQDFEGLSGGGGGGGGVPTKHTSASGSSHSNTDQSEADVKAYQEAYTKAASASPAAKYAHDAWCSQVDNWKEQEALATRVSQILYQRQISEHWAARNYHQRGYATSLSEAMAAHAGMSTSWMSGGASPPLVPGMVGNGMRGFTTSRFAHRETANAQAHVVTLDQLLSQILARRVNPNEPRLNQPQANANAADANVPNDNAPNAAGANGVEGVGEGGAVRVRRLHFALVLNGDDIKLALKLIVAVGLFGQNGDERRWITLITVAIVVFVYQVYTNNRNRRRQAEAVLAREGVAGAGAAAAAAPNAAGQAGNSEEEDLNQELPPLQARGLLQGGIAPGGGFIVDIAYFFISFLLSMYPGWQPVPVCDPIIVARRRILERRRAQARGELPPDLVPPAAATHMNNEATSEQPEEEERPQNGHLHQD